MAIAAVFDAPIIAAFSYGSTLDMEGKDHSAQADYILIVENTEEFHSITKQQYPSHYSTVMKMLSPRSLSFINDRIPAGLFFHPYVSFDKLHLGQKVFSPSTNFSKVKYGVTSLASALRDLNEWHFLYLAGRLQKPVKWMQPIANVPLLYKAMENNLLSALVASLLMLDQEKRAYSLLDLFIKIVSLSYSGDMRMMFAEDPRKMLKIISMKPFDDQPSSPIYPFVCALEELYLPLVKKIGDIDICQEAHSQNGISITKDVITTLRNRKLSFPTSDSYRRYLFSHLPMDIQLNHPSCITTPENLAHCKEIDLSHLGLKKRVFYSSTIQATKGILTAGPEKSINYLARKISKRLF